MEGLGLPTTEQWISQHILDNIEADHNKEVRICSQWRF